MSPAGWITLVGLLALALALGAVMRARSRPGVEAGPKATDRPQTDPALSPLVETQGVPLGLSGAGEKNRIEEDLAERERRARTPK